MTVYDQIPGESLTPASDLHLGDVVRVFNGPYGDATVKGILDNGILLFRPYVSTADFHIGDNVICYIGVEEFMVSKSGHFRVVGNICSRASVPYRAPLDQNAGKDYSLLDET